MAEGIGDKCTCTDTFNLSLVITPTSLFGLYFPLLFICLFSSPPPCNLLFIASSVFPGQFNVLQLSLFIIMSGFSGHPSSDSPAVSNTSLLPSFYSLLLLHLVIHFMCHPSFISTHIANVPSNNISRRHGNLSNIYHKELTKFCKDISRGYLIKCSFSSITIRLTYVVKSLK